VVRSELRIESHDEPPRRRLARAVRIALVAAFCLAGGVALGLYSTGVGATFGPRRGPPDTLKTGIPAPKGPALLQTRYLERELAPVDERRQRIEELADRYNVTGTLAELIHDVAVENNIDPELGFRLIRVESVFDTNARGSGGALGLTQLMPGTARDIDPKVRSNKEIMDPRTNLRLGFTNLRNMIERYDGDVRLGVIAYNRGEIAVDRALRRGRDPENGYGRRVLGPAHHGGKPYAGPGLWEKKEGTKTSTAAAETRAQ
jgi:hypothetical protein